MQLCILSPMDAALVQRVTGSIVYELKVFDVDSRDFHYSFLSYAMHLVYMVQAYGRFAPLSCMWAYGPDDVGKVCQMIRRTLSDISSLLARYEKLPPLLVYSMTGYSAPQRCREK